MQFPTVIGGVVPWSTSKASPRPAGLTGPVLGDIFLGKITNWTDPAIKPEPLRWPA
jgi:phosphate transport system substrate-binding protein